MAVWIFSRRRKMQRSDDTGPAFPHGGLQGRRADGPCARPRLSTVPTPVLVGRARLWHRPAQGFIEQALVGCLTGRAHVHWALRVGGPTSAGYFVRLRTVKYAQRHALYFPGLGSHAYV